jgi:PIN domain nuclease of toxin-antitoxin system
LSGFLLDTNIALLALAAPDKLSGAARALIQRGRNNFSVVSYWEVMLKVAKGKLEVGDPRVWWETALSDLAATALPFRADHVAEIYQLRPIHQDPFDRALIAQATAERLTLVTIDGEIPKYASDRLKVIHLK